MLSRPLVQRGSKTQPRSRPVARQTSCAADQFRINLSTGSLFQLANAAAAAGLVMSTMAGRPILLQRC
jgi:hypothetical protein